jgi:hypothetical protein
MLGLVPSWEPGNSLVAKLLATVTALQRSVNLYKLGITALDVATINEGSAELTNATGLLDEANGLLTNLRQQTGFGC